ncbi:sensor histidine kinase [uncultured Chitinophaga sp.]|uniref:ATP-binding protein n=1 Tax=uncultured Chitinophaga sp. TaxID=339340 RepID=UPI0025CD8C2B|nr:sensor histidine kinase [uncultured Chitinophaga sp.]
MRKLCSLISLLLVCIYTNAQRPLDRPRYQDSMELALLRSATDSARAITSYRLSEYWAALDIVKADGYLNGGYKAAEKSAFLRAAYYYYAAYYVSQTKPDTAEILYLKADSLLTRFKTKHAWNLRSKALHRYALLRQQKDDPKLFAEIMIGKAIPLARMSGDSTLISKNYLGIGYVFRNSGEYEKAEQYMEKAMEVLRSTPAPLEQHIINLHALAENYSLAGKNERAKPLLDSARMLLQPYPKSEHWLDYYAAESLYYNTDTLSEAALAGLEKGIALAKELKMPYAEQRMQLQRYYAWYNIKNYTKALEVIQYLIQQKEMMAIATNRLLLYSAMAETNAGLGDMARAYDWQKRYSDASDSFNNSRLKTEIHAMEIKFGQVESKKRIAVLEAEKQKAALSARNTRLTMWLLIAVTCSLIIAVFYFRNNKRLLAQKQINLQQELREMDQQRQLATSHAMIEGEERERSRLARDLHDGLGGMLAGVKIKLSALKPEQPEGERLHGVILQLDNSIRELRHIARNMMPESLLKFGLETALKDLCESMMAGGTEIDFQAYNIEKDIPVSEQVTIYRIIQEALNNAIRHGHASSVLLQCSQNEHLFFITIEDNGRGFNMHINDAGKGIGLENIRNRTLYLNGKLDITSAINEGTTINIELHVGNAS